MATPVVTPPGSLLDEKLKKSSPGKIGGIVFGIMLVVGLIYIGTKLSSDLSVVHSTSVFPFVLLGVALFIALAFEFVNGFHDTANAVATCIYTHSLEPHIAVVYSGIMNFIGVLLSSGAVAFSIITLLPVELILKVSKGAGFSMVFALLMAAILWNLATWWRGLPASSSHTMIGSIIGVGVANQLMQGNSGTSGVEWDQVIKVFKALLLSPVIGFAMAALLFLLFKLPPRRSTFVCCSSVPVAVSATSMVPMMDRREWASSCSSWSALCRLPMRLTTQWALGKCKTSQPSPRRWQVCSATTSIPAQYLALQNRYSRTSSARRSMNPTSSLLLSKWLQTSVMRPTPMVPLARCHRICKPTFATRCT